MKLLAVDPGDSTGYAVFDGDEVESAGTASLEDFVHSLAEALYVTGPGGSASSDQELVSRLRGVEHVVMEDWVIYKHKAMALIGDPCRTPRGIGVMEFICQLAGIPYTQQPAKIKETAEAAGAEELFDRPLHENRHANDAKRHGVYFLKVAPFSKAVIEEAKRREREWRGEDATA